jgi:hypothetical protein
MTADVFSDRPPVPLAPQIFPTDAHAVIYRPSRSAMTSGKARTRNWKLRFEHRTPPVIEPLMGWTGRADTLAQVELSFPSSQTAIAYAEQQGLAYTVQGMVQRDPELRVITSSTEAERAAATARRQRLEWVENTLGPNAIRYGLGPGVDPAALYTDPQDVLRNKELKLEQKRELLRRWALDAYILELTCSDGRLEAEGSRLQEVMDALIALDQPPRCGQEDNAIAPWPELGSEHSHACGVEPGEPQEDVPTAPIEE